MRLIDADALKQDLRKCQIESLIAHTEEKNVFDIINEQPTAYDVKKVEEKLKLLLDLAKSALNSEIEISAGRKTFIQERYMGHIEMVEQLIDIVTRGGVE